MTRNDPVREALAARAPTELAGPTVADLEREKDALIRDMDHLRSVVHALEKRLQDETEILGEKLDSVMVENDTLSTDNKRLQRELSDARRAIMVLTDAKVSMQQYERAAMQAYLAGRNTP